MELKKGTLLQGGKYKIEQTLGQGSFGITYLATAKFSASGNLGKMDVVAKVAIKEFFMSDINGRKEDGSTVEGSTGSIFTNYKKRFRKEAENLSKLIHPNIVKVYDVFDENNTTYYVMEYLSETNLNKYIEDNHGLQEQECIELTNGIGDALQYMHNALMLHLDLKPGNIMLRNGKPVLIDFGLSKQFNANGKPETSTTIGKGTPGYASLEQQNYNGIQSNGLPYAMDVYALGGTMFKMITAETPPDASSIFNDGFPKDELLNRRISVVFANVIEKAMAPSKKERFQTVSELLMALPETKVKSKSKSKSSVVSTNVRTKNLEESTNFANFDDSKIQTTTGTEAALKVGSKIKLPPGDFYVVDKVYSGSYNFTYFCHDIDKRIHRVVVRELFFQDYNCRKEGLVTSLGDIDYINRYRHRFSEVGNILKEISGHPNLENYVDCFNANGTCYIITQYISGETLSDIQKRTKRNFTEKEVFAIIKQICNGLTYMHSNGILHLDVKPSNIIKSSNNRYILLDFGLSKITSDTDTSENNIGCTPGYSSIEQHGGNGMLTPASDIYSLGATMYKLLTGEKPKQAYEILNDGFQSMESKLKEANVSVGLIKVIKIAMNPLIKNRYQSPEALSKALSEIKQPTLSSNNQTKIINKKSSSQKEFKSFDSLPNWICIDLESNVDNPRIPQIFIDKKYGVYGKKDLAMERVGEKMLGWNEYVETIRRLDTIIQKYHVPNKDTGTSTLSLYFEVGASTYQFFLDTQSLSDIINIVPYQREFNLERFLQNFRNPHLMDSIFNKRLFNLADVLEKIGQPRKYVAYSIYAFIFSGAFIGCLLGKKDDISFVGILQLISLISIILYDIGNGRCIASNNDKSRRLPTIIAILGISLYLLSFITAILLYFIIQ